MNLALNQRSRESRCARNVARQAQILIKGPKNIQTISYLQMWSARLADWWCLFLSFSLFGDSAVL